MRFDILKVKSGFRLLKLWLEAVKEKAAHRRCWHHVSWSGRCFLHPFMDVLLHPALVQKV